MFLCITQDYDFECCKNWIKSFVSVLISVDHSHQDNQQYLWFSSSHIWRKFFTKVLKKVLYTFIFFFTKFTNIIFIILLGVGVAWKNEWGKFYPKRVIQKKLSTNKWRKKYYPEELSKFFFQINATSYHTNDTTQLYI